jgi:hypothetical protein
VSRTAPTAVEMSTMSDDELQALGISDGVIQYIRALKRGEDAFTANYPGVIPSCPSWCAEPEGHAYRNGGYMAYSRHHNSVPERNDHNAGQHPFGAYVTSFETLDEACSHSIRRRSGFAWAGP